MSIAHTLRDITGLLEPSERIRAARLVGLLAVLAAVEVAGVASIAPLLLILGDPQIITTNKIINKLFVDLGFSSYNSFIIFFAIGTLVFICLISVFRAVLHYVKFLYANEHRHRIATRLLNASLDRDYRYFLDKNVAELTKTILVEVDELVENAVVPALVLVAQGLMALAVVLFLLAIDPLLALLLTASAGGMFALIYVFTREVLGRIGRERLKANGERFKASTDVLGGIKELKVLGREGTFLAAYSRPSKRYCAYRTLSGVLAETPKYVIEAVGFASILLISIYLVVQQEHLASALPVIGLYAFAGFRLLPAFHKVYSSVALLRFAAPAVGAIAEELRQAPGGGGRHGIGTRGEERLCLRRSIELEHVSFRYDGARPAAICDLSLTIAAGSVTGIVGPSGVGKSTLVDLLLGLLRPDEGRILIDGTPLTEANVRAWQNNIGYVPQHIFLADDTVARNIAFGIEAEAIDRQAVERAARLAQIHDFIVQLPDGYATCVGERGVRLSGGQRQRLGIARALYHEPDIVIFDEATNALDHETEANLLAAVEGLAGQKTIIMITHRLATLHKRARIVELHRGRLRKADTVPVEHAEAVLAVREAPQAAAVGAVHSVAPGR
ncbi:ABC transporter ATP-binding protein/permease [Mesorhizobium sp. C280B]|uniref:ABC transporter ATP-binding protein n=1 Tax=Mesorhizobium sp. C280B TaxID=2956828 RepID=UPI003334CB85